MMAKRLLVYICLLLSFYGISQNTNNHREDLLSIEKIHQDLTILKENLEAIHTGLYNYTSKERFNEVFDSLKIGISEPLSAIEFYRKIVILHKYIKNGHTIIIPPEAFDQATATVTSQFPLDIYWDGQSTYVLRNNSRNLNIPIGVELESINGEPVKQLFLDFSSKWTRDGRNITFPRGITQRAFSGFFINLIGKSDSYEISYSDIDGLAQYNTISAISNTEIQKNRDKRYGPIRYYWSKEDGEAITLNIKKNIAHLKVKTCSNSDIRKFGLSIKGIIRRHFKKIFKHNIEHLIIDIRDNPGGNDIVARELLKHISHKNFKLFDDSYLKSNRIPNKHLYKGNIGFINFFAKIGLTKGNDGFYRVNELGSLFFRTKTMLKEHSPYKRKFKGKIYTLINPYSFSAAGEMASFIKTNTNSIFIGEEAGGNSNAIVAGENFTLELPNSKNRVVIPVVQQKIHTTVTPTDRGVIPDYIIRNTVEQEIKGYDSVLNFTLNLIDNQSID